MNKIQEKANKYNIHKKYKLDQQTKKDKMTPFQIRMDNQHYK